MQTLKPLAQDVKIYCGPYGSGKTTNLSKDLKIITGNGVKGYEILVLLPDNDSLNEWKHMLSDMSPFQPSVFTYQSFIKNEIMLFYPLVLNSCDGIANKNAAPCFIGFEAARFLLSKAIEGRREYHQFFNQVASDSNSLAAEICYTLFEAACNAIPIKDLAARFTLSLEKRDPDKEKIYSQFEETAEAYCRKCFQLGVFDAGMAMNIYNTILLGDGKYRETLVKRYKCLIADNLERQPQVFISLIELMAGSSGLLRLGYDAEACEAYTCGMGRSAIENRIVKMGEKVELKNSRTCSAGMFRLSKALYSTIHDIPETTDAAGILELVPSFPLRSEMLEAAGERISDLICKDGFEPGDIAVLSTYADPVTQYVLESKLSKHSVGVSNLSRKVSFIENAYSRALLTLARICLPLAGMKHSIDDIRSLMGVLFGIDAVSCWEVASLYINSGQSALPEYQFLQDAGLSVNIEKSRYDFIRERLMGYTGTKLELESFFRSAFSEILLKPETSDTDFRKALTLIESARNFEEAVSGFGRNSVRDFIEAAFSGLVSSGIETDLQPEMRNVLLMTPATALTIPGLFKVLIILSASSKNWMPSFATSISNRNTLSCDWNVGQIYTTGIDDAKRRGRLAAECSVLLRKTSGKVIVFESDLSSNGYENDGILADCFYKAAGGA